MNAVRMQLENAMYDLDHTLPKVLVTAVRLPSGAIETAENREQIDAKLSYIHGAYDEDMRLKTNPAIEMVGFMLVTVDASEPCCTQPNLQTFGGEDSPYMKTPTTVCMNCGRIHR